MLRLKYRPEELLYRAELLRTSPRALPASHTAIIPLLPDQLTSLFVAVSALHGCTQAVQGLSSSPYDAT